MHADAPRVRAAARTRLLLAATLLGVAGCDLPTGEVDNPLRFRVVAVVEGPDGVERVDAADGRLSCNRFEDLDPSETVTDNRCVGGYVLYSELAGFGLHFADAADVPPDTIPLTGSGGDLYVLFHGTPATGSVTFSRAVRRYETYSNDWYLDVAGAFDIAAGAWRVRHGLFFSER